MAEEAINTLAWVIIVIHAIWSESVVDGGWPLYLATYALSCYCFVINLLSTYALSSQQEPGHQCMANILFHLQSCRNAHCVALHTVALCLSACQHSGVGQLSVSFPAMIAWWHLSVGQLYVNGQTGLHIMAARIMGRII